MSEREGSFYELNEGVIEGSRRRHEEKVEGKG
jgi:hypothetical protein